MSTNENETHEYEGPVAGARVVVVGLGYVGLPLAVRAAQVGHRVIGFDLDENRVKSLCAGRSYIEDVPTDLVERLVDSGELMPTVHPRDLAGFDVALIAVPTPLQEGLPDLGYVESAARTLARYLRPGATVVVESTTYPGTTADLVAPLLEEGSGLVPGEDFFLGYSPERIDPGNPTWTLLNTPKIVAGVNEQSQKAVQAFYDTVVETTIPVSSTQSAELAKLLENTFRHVNIALVNEIAMFADGLGIDVWEAIEAASTKPYGFMRFTPGPGVGGHCLPIDPSYLSWHVERKLGQSFRFVELANDINEHMPDYVVRRVGQALNRRRRSINGSRILLLGLSYKKNTGDARESPAVRVVTLLSSLGAEVRGADPFVLEPTPVDDLVERVEATAEEVAAATAVVLLTDHDGFDYDLIARHASLVIDCRHRMAGPLVEYL
ncbi:UDP-N-acetyl-D-glucosamine dehydrogenase [Actinopolymorpha cephalotaxi]|uniref:UDP-N-acetyl-D-glucosamine dehydrogenase n=1 Tax=Actinopolymorpha cephalotaxi TaxID=504797 RepID=A0A1I2WQ91_9ACTN|nr:nucleotide sugar dehydrogenase [Actinopolymorpha cephalotaxi]NYH85050.1 UDP-N-acetyl-D-glucosamine dehydrogenase [Actinopolymorpha cephalotaxi]SFH02857.1 UDP-N-acetyl-D-glucosamine dehydrogenase [Actinopolymorpha cephalotaxi]